MKDKSEKTLRRPLIVSMFFLSCAVAFFYNAQSIQAAPEFIPVDKTVAAGECVTIDLKKQLIGVVDQNIFSWFVEEAPYPITLSNSDLLKEGKLTICNYTECPTIHIRVTGSVNSEKRSVKVKLGIINDPPTPKIRQGGQEWPADYDGNIKEFPKEFRPKDPPNPFIEPNETKYLKLNEYVFDPEGGKITWMVGDGNTRGESYEGTYFTITIDNTKGLAAIKGNQGGDGGAIFWATNLCGKWDEAELNIIVNTRPKILIGTTDECPGIEFRAGEEYKRNLDNCVDDAENKPYEIKWNEIDGDHVTVEVDANRIAKFSVDSSWSGRDFITFTATDKNGATDTRAVEVNVLPANPRMVTSPTALDFSDVLVGKSKSLPLTISNVVEIINITTNPPFSVPQMTFPITIEPDRDYPITVAFTPTIQDVGKVNGELSIETNDPNLPIFAVSLSGKGIGQAKIDIEPKTLGFGNVSIGDSEPGEITISNVGTENLEVTDITCHQPEKFSISETNFTVVPGDANVITIIFTPPKFDEVKCSLQIESNDPNSPLVVVLLSGMGVSPQIDVSSTALDFGEVPIGDSQSLNLTIANVGTEDLEINDISTEPPFSVLPITPPITIASGNNYIIDVTFTPQNVGRILPPGELSIDSNDPNSPQKEVSLLGTGIEPRIKVSPAALDFGEVSVGNFKSLNLTILNLGTEDLEINNITTEPELPFSVLPITSPITITPGNDYPISVTFTPRPQDVDNVVNGKLSIDSNDPNSPPKVPLSGTGISPKINVSTTTLNFGDVLVDNSKPLEITISNVGTANLEVTNITSNQPDFSVSETTFTVVPNGTNKITVTFEPVSVAPVPQDSELSIDSNDNPNSPLVVSLSGTGIGQPEIDVSPTPLAFGDVSVGASKSLPLTISNVGTANLEVTNIISNQPEFSVDKTTFTLVPGSAEIITVTFNPLKAGEAKCSLNIESNDPKSPLVVVSLSGKGIGQPKNNVFPTSLAFGNVVIGDAKSLELRVSNVGTEDLTITNITSNQPEFTVSETTFTVVPGSANIIAVTFKQVSFSEVTGELNLESNDPKSPLTVELSGTGSPTCKSPPTILTSGIPAPFTVNEGESKSITLSNKVQDDCDKPENITWSSVENPNIQVEIRGDMAVFSPKKDCWYGTQEVFLIATDSDGQSSMTSILVSIVPVPKLPKIDKEKFPSKITIKTGEKVTDSEVLSPEPSEIETGKILVTLPLNDKIIEGDCGPQKIEWTVDESQHVAITIENSLATISVEDSWYGTEQVEFKASVKDHPELYDTILLSITVLSAPPIILAEKFVQPVEFLVNTSKTLLLDDKVKDDETPPGEIIWTIESNNIQATISNSDTLFMTADAVGNETVVLTATDGDGQSDSIPLQVQVIAPPIIDLPIWMLWQNELNLDIRDIKEWKFQPKRHVIPILNGNILSFIVQPDDWYGVEEIGYIATYDNGLSASGTIIVIALPNQLTFYETSASSNSLVTSITREDGTPLLLEWTSNGSEHIKVDIDNQTVTFTPRQENWAGEEEVKFTATNDSGRSESCSIKVKFTSFPEAPVISDDFPSEWVFDSGFQSDPLPLADYVDDSNNDEITWESDVRPGADGEKHIKVDIVNNVAIIFSLEDGQEGWRGKEHVLLTATDTTGLSNSILLTVIVNGDPPRIDVPPFKLWQDGMDWWNLELLVNNIDQRKWIEWTFEPGINILPEVAPEQRRVKFHPPNPDWFKTDVIHYTATDVRDGQSVDGYIAVIMLPNSWESTEPLSFITSVEPEGKLIKLVWEDTEAICVDVDYEPFAGDRRAIFSVSDDTCAAGKVVFRATSGRYSDQVTVTVNIEAEAGQAPIILRNRFSTEKGFSLQNENLVLKMAENDVVKVNIADKIAPADKVVASPSYIVSRGIKWTVKRSEHVDVKIDNVEQTVTFAPDAPNGWKNSVNADKPEIVQLTATDKLGNSDTVHIAVTINYADGTALFTNYPNPFNSETWIPYQLSEGDNVIIRIYNHTGQLVRVIDLGHQRSGIYATKDKAVSWNGRDNAGENVASGVYFYTLQTERFTATRKMLIVK